MGKGKNLHGKDSGVAAEDIVKSPDISKLPGKTNLVQEQEVGDLYIDHGAVCEGTAGDGANGCFLTDPQRAKLIEDFKIWTVGGARANYNLALEAVSIEELMKKDDDLPWVLSLALDVAGNFVVSTAISAVRRLRSGQIQRLMDEAIGGPPAYKTKFGRKLATALEGTSPEQITTRIKQGGDWANKKAKAFSKTVLNAEGSKDKGVALSYLARLSSGVDVSFRDFIRNATGTASDAELVVLWEGMQPEYHNKEMYKDELRAKLSRFKQSGVGTIGRTKANDGGELRRANVIRDKRVVWVLGEDGQRTLWFHKHDASYNPNVVHRGDDPAMDQALYGAQQYKFGDRGGKVSNKPDNEVPKEFWNEAVEISEERWGRTQTLKRRGDAYVPFLDISNQQDVLVTGSPSSPVRTNVRGYDAKDFAHDIGTTIGSPSRTNVRGYDAKDLADDVGAIRGDATE